MNNESGLNFKATELRLGLPGTDESEEIISHAKASKRNASAKSNDHETAPANKIGIFNCRAQIVGWPPVRSYRKNNMKTENESGIYVKVSMDGAPYLRKIDLKVYDGYPQLLKALETMFKLTIGDYSERDGFKGSEYAPAYEDKDGDLMLVGDVPWDMFMSSCKRLRIMKGSEAKGLACGV
ncbi:hypothetical protein DH2020_019864 [Rehmannia glutinosa]|uniref:Auxin-responsive protein n=1 Tax=Rehmannia glutinosa TaxID=99300 RepID=A0ABR0WIN1_REHGL